MTTFSLNMIHSQVDLLPQPTKEILLYIRSDTGLDWSIRLKMVAQVLAIMSVILHMKRPQLLVVLQEEILALVMLVTIPSRTSWILPMIVV